MASNFRRRMTKELTTLQRQKQQPKKHYQQICITTYINSGNTSVKQDKCKEITTETTRRTTANTTTKPQKKNQHHQGQHK